VRVADWGFLTQPRPGAVVHRPRPGRAAARHRGQDGRTAYGIVTDLTEAGYVGKHKDGRRNCYQTQAHLPLPETDSRERTISEVLALLGNTGGRDGLPGLADAGRPGGVDGAVITTGPA
jgi:hypothetical protein